MEQVKPLDSEFLSWALDGASNLTPEQVQRLAILQREDVVKPTFYVGAGTCGLGAGAADTLEAVKAFARENNLDADIVEVGCVGLCAVEPIVDVQLPGKNRIAFQQMTKDEVPAVLDALVNKGEVVADHLMGQYRGEETAAWDGTIFIDEHPFFAPQTRWVLANCGLINPAPKSFSR
jgi:(2Fe-2S) ferredoxin